MRGEGYFATAFSSCTGEARFSRRGAGMTTCVNCGASVAPDAQFCSKCGTAVWVVPQTVSAATPTRSTWWIVPVVIVGLVIVAWLLLAGLPFGGGKKKEVVTATTETIAEGTAVAPPAETGTVVEVGTAEEPPFVTQTAPPPLATETMPPQTGSGPVERLPPVIVEERPVTPQPMPPQPLPTAPRPTPRPVPTTPAPQPEPQAPSGEPRGEISEGEATAALRNHLASSNPYDGVSSSCLQLRSVGYVNVGYTYSVWDACVEGGGTRMLGRWRVDAKTREVFRQGDDGRYIRP
jgi:ribosomal protein L40E